MNKVRIMALAVVAALAALPSALAQTVTGSVTGTVADPSGAVIAGAKVALINELTKQERDQDTGASGDFAFTEIVPGTYDVTITKDGFNTYSQRGVVVATSESGAAPDLDAGRFGNARSYGFSFGGARRDGQRATYGPCDHDADGHDAELRLELPEHAAGPAWCDRNDY